jgi:hypothetical protein
MNERPTHTGPIEILMEPSFGQCYVITRFGDGTPIDTMAAALTAIRDLQGLAPGCVFTMRFP